eukprot:CAMPEP_0173273186 /NCGR_PEP_ID=MMETSP1143-20121109/1768_1 /TAXON_ID=483371 /ORGANISM="non described non described, Strain CCMP2298" /LENGTH=216 /DNA_ID=CAMNT_0014209905 /DNA_START=525 /DNA_END=1176 /DNA_ORIENTATION=+
MTGSVAQRVRHRCSAALLLCCPVAERLEDQLRGGAQVALIRYANWRIEEDVDNVANPETLVKFKKEIDSGKVVFGFRDLNGRPASFLWAHRHKANDRDIAQVKLLTIWTLEGLRKLAKPEEEMFVICFDLSRFSMSCMDYEAVKQLITILQAHYPDTLAKLLLIDAPFLFSACWAIIRGWLDPVTANKVQFIKKSDLSKFFDVETLPQEGEIQLEA